MHYLLSLLLIFSFTFAQKTTTITKQADGEKKIEVKVNIAGDKVLYTVTEDGKTEEFEADVNDEEILAKIHKKLEAHDIDEKIKIKVCKQLKDHDCKKLSCDPNTCDHKKTKDCSKDAMILHMKDDGSHKKHKYGKKHKMMDKSFFSGEKAGFLGIQLQDLSEQLSDHFKVKDGNGVLISEVVKDSPAEKAGLKAGDIIIKVDDDVIENAGDLRSVIRSYKPEEKVSISVIRDGKKKKLNATLGETEQEYFHNFGNFEGFEFPEFQFDQQEFEEKMEEMQEQLQELKLELKELREE
ncbi:MAG: PDZ domain-containing protein [Candidatus Neomarinimicrobiota bacterium]